jgi:hypothetical protein
MKFFQEHLRNVILTNFTPKANTEGEKRLRVDFEMSLADPNNMRLAPRQVTNAFKSCAELANAQTSIKITKEFEAQDIEFYEPKVDETHVASADEIQFHSDPSMILKGVTVRGLVVSRPDEGAGDTGAVKLIFHVNTPIEDHQLTWIWQHFPNTVWVKFLEGQAEVAGTEEIDDDAKARRKANAA